MISRYPVRAICRISTHLKPTRRKVKAVLGRMIKSGTIETDQPSELPLILGGHSFISQLGSDPPVSEQDQHRIVESCLGHGIRWFDTTYQPERIALGSVLHALDRRNEATIMAWNFFTDFSPDDAPTKPEYYRPNHIDVILEQLHTDYVDCLVAIPLDDPEKSQRQEELLIEWQKKGYVRFLGLWIEDPRIIERYRNYNPFRFAIRPFNITTADAAPIFAACKKVGWETIATSPFKRGWELDRIIATAVARGYGEDETLRPIIADLMLRFSLFEHDVDRVIIGMRKVEWINRNGQSVFKGQLTAEESRRLQHLRGLTKEQHWWQRIRRLF
jgi:aryl-alcohol dehydrogenase-like predicted oxidoreductase